MNDEQLLKRIEQNRDVMAGKPVVRGTRLSVEFILNLLAHGASDDEILAEYQGLESDDIRACLLFAGKLAGDASFMPRGRESA
ncbi:MAG: DUF433 domain-containing protein [Persicimonas sp.]